MQPEDKKENEKKVLSEKAQPTNLGTSNQIHDSLIKELEAYRLAIENLAIQKEGYVFQNSGKDHAAIVMGNIFRTSQKCVKIYAGDFNGDVSDNPYYLSRLNAYLSRNLPLRVIFESEPNKNSKALNLIKDYAVKGGDVVIRKLKNKPPFPEHFTIADGRMFRIETSKENYQAYCSFNNQEITSSFEEKFKELEVESDVFSN